MRKAISLILALVMIFSFSGSADAAQTTSGMITAASVGIVVEVFDADAIAVRLFSNGHIAYVKLLGVSTETYQGGMKYMQDNVFGRRVTLVPDYSGSVSSLSGRWNLMYVYLSPDGTTSTSGREMLNQSLVKYGYAEVDERYKSISQYNMLANEQKSAKNQKIGMWGDELNGYYSLSDKININTASRQILQQYMNGLIPDLLVNNIVTYRSYTPFSSVGELKFVSGMTKEIFDSNKGLFTVITNINTATEKELNTLEYATTENISNLLKYRNSHTFSSLTELYSAADVEWEFYDRNKYYMSVNNSTKMVYAKPDKVVNINTASESQLSGISDVGSSLASRIVSSRRNGYTLKTLTELQQLSSSSLSAESINKLSDNCHLYTDINTASRLELESLFGSSYVTSEINNIISGRNYTRLDKLRDYLSSGRYDRIIDYVYIDEPSLPERVNLNTATEAQLREIGMTYNDARSIISAQRGMRMASQIPVDVSAYDKNVALYTNINTASLKELRSLNAFSESMLSQIVSYRDDQPFGSESELADFFENNRLLSTYRSVSEFIVVR